jgi:hypothetical protein
MLDLIFGGHTSIMVFVDRLRKCIYWLTPGDIAGLISKPYSFDQLREVLRGVVEEKLPKLG